MLAFLSGFLKFYLADTPHRGNTKCLRGGSEQYQERSGVALNNIVCCRGGTCCAWGDRRKKAEKT